MLPSYPVIPPQNPSDLHGGGWLVGFTSIASATARRRRVATRGFETLFDALGILVLDECDRLLAEESADAGLTERTGGADGRHAVHVLGLLALLWTI